MGLFVIINVIVFSVQSLLHKYTLHKYKYTYTITHYVFHIQIMYTIETVYSCKGIYTYFRITKI